MGQITISDPNVKLFLGRFLPLGSLRRKLFFYLGIPILGLLVLAGIFDQVIMPIVTRQGADFPLPSYVDQKVI